MKNLPKLVMIVWEDAAHDTTGWGDGLEQATKFKIPLVLSVGWLMAQNKRGVKIAQSLTDDNVAQTLVVPAKMIKKFVELPSRRKEK
ncbi:MAG: hypothetical protein EBT15_12195 [Betaproteobacteria bacterium]|nr:hypothetical protein [Betaproteobacteria bacterium]